MASAQNSFSYDPSELQLTSPSNYHTSYQGQGLNAIGNWIADNFLGTNINQQLSDAAEAYNQNLAEDYFTNKANAFSEYMQDKANAFSEQMSNTTYQRSVQDMIEAGINPMVMFANNGGSAQISSPQSAYSGGSAGHAANMVHARIDNAGVLGKALGNMVNNFTKTVDFGGAAEFMNVASGQPNKQEITINHKTGEVFDAGKTTSGIMDTLAEWGPLLAAM